MDHKPDKLEIDIWGCCVSRDIFSLGGGDNYTINNYYQECSFVSAFSDHTGPEIDDIFFESELGKKKPVFYQKCFKNDYNKTLVKNLMKSKSKWLVLDFRYVQYGLKRINYSSGGSEYITASGLSEWGLEILKSKNIKFDIEYVNPHEFNYTPYLLEMIDFCKKKYGKNIILVEAREAYDTYDYFSDNEKISCHTPCIKSIALEKNISLEYKLNIEFIKSTKCYVIKSPQNNMSDLNCIWDPSSVHYIHEYYGYGKKAMDIITQGKAEDILPELDLIYLETCFKLHEIRVGNIESVRNILHKIDNNIKYGNTQIAFDICTNLANKNNPDAMVRLSRFYFNGQIVDKDINSAANWMRRAIKLQNNPNYSEYLNVLWHMGTLDSYDEMISILNPLIEAGIGYSFGWMSRLYRDGRGVPQNLDVAAEYMRKAIEENIPWARNELYDILWKIDTPSAFEEMIEVIKPCIDSGDGYAMGRMGNAYYEGKGVPLNSEIAAEWMKKASKYGCVWAQKKLDHIEASNKNVNTENIN